MIRKTQDMVLTTGLLGGAAVAGACYVGWIKPDQIEEVADAAAQQVGVSGMLTSLFASVPDEVKDVKRSKKALSKIYKAAPGLVAGTAAGFALGYKLG